MSGVKKKEWAGFFMPALGGASRGSYRPVHDDCRKHCSPGFANNFLGDRRKQENGKHAKNNIPKFLVKATFETSPCLHVPFVIIFAHA